MPYISVENFSEGHYIPTEGPVIKPAKPIPCTKHGQDTVTVDNLPCDESPRTICIRCGEVS